jgi:hypothetical protein
MGGSDTARNIGGSRVFCQRAAVANRPLLTQVGKVRIRVPLCMALGRPVFGTGATSNTQRLYQMLDLLGWHYVIRFRSNITVTHAGESRPDPLPLLPGHLLVRMSPHHAR